MLPEWQWIGASSALDQKELRFFAPKPELRDGPLASTGRDQTRRQEHRSTNTRRTAIHSQIRRRSGAGRACLCFTSAILVVMLGRAAITFLRRDRNREFFLKNCEDRNRELNRSLDKTLIVGCDLLVHA